MKKIEELITECCICREWKDNKGNYYVPSTQDRREAYSNHKHISHGMCDPCYILWEDREMKD